ncbi:TRAP transporter small permease subunit [Azospirillum sp. RWY-5-1]|uniref:TRAP transporter small permease protein n=1 Tax=Azospirillum oleiclasticum TaxID=2735135 RepID=A0ABX2TEK8_9PROT|nr:TRAP transporter small permease subunit [Azospirillum oleiclasticum]NYZ15459.1 TRAP transporter small permease subunit [Azospirillum oleiclasticum]NYZ22482.1 TRAP transporter small permease subunit [Azospirillum oleiclasticum]
MHAFIRAIDRLTGSVGLVGGWLIAPLVIGTCYEVFARYVLGSPTIWAYELGYMLTGANFLLGMAFALRQDAHIRVDVLYLRFSPRTKALVNSLAYLFIVIPVCAWLSVALYGHAMQSILSLETSGQSAWNPVVWPFRISFFVAFTVLTLQALAELGKCVLLLRGTAGATESGIVLPHVAGQPGSH